MRDVFLVPKDVDRVLTNFFCLDVNGCFAVLFLREVCLDGIVTWAGCRHGQLSVACVFGCHVDIKWIAGDEFCVRRQTFTVCGALRFVGTTEDCGAE